MHTLDKRALDGSTLTVPVHTTLASSIPEAAKACRLSGDQNHVVPPQKVAQDARAMDAMTKDRDRLAQELAACQGRLAAANAEGEERAKALADAATERQQVHMCHKHVAAASKILASF